MLLHEAFGDHQVANVATETEARIIGARLRTPALDPGRSRDRVPFYGIKRIPRYPWKGNALTVFDIGPLRPAGCSGRHALRRHAAGPDHQRGAAARRGPARRSPPLELDAVFEFTDFLQVGGGVRRHTAPSGKPCYAAGWTGP